MSRRATGFTLRLGYRFTDTAVHGKAVSVFISVKVYKASNCMSDEATLTVLRLVSCGPNTEGEAD